MSLLGFGAGCAAARERQNQAIDPELRDSAQRWQRPRMFSKDIGPYQLAKIDVRQLPYDGRDGASVSVNGAGREASTFRARVTVAEKRSGQKRTAECETSFLREGLAELDGVLRSQTTQLKLRCTVANKGPTWRFVAAGPVGSNLSGRLTQDGHPTAGFDVDFELLNRLRGRRAAPVVHLRDENGARAAGVLTYPERLWVDPALEGDTTLSLVAFMLTLRNLELEPPKRTRRRKAEAEEDDDVIDKVLDVF